MRHISPLLLISLILLAPPAAAQRAKRPTERTDRIERHGITWHFAERHLTGAFANGDPWVNGPVRIRRITPAAVNLDGRHVHGAMIDPDPTSLRQGYDSLLYGKWSDGTYHESLDVGRLLAAGDEVRLLPGQSLVSVASKTTADDRLPQLLIAAVLTCVDRRPADDAFRPPYCKAPERDKQVQFRRRDLDLDALGRLEKVAGMPDPDEVADRFERLWLDHFPSWVGRLAHPIEAMPDYGRDLAAWTGSAALLLNTKGNQKALEPLLIRFVQLGIASTPLFLTRRRQASHIARGTRARPARAARDGSPRSSRACRNGNAGSSRRTRGGSRPQPSRGRRPRRATRSR